MSKIIFEPPGLPFFRIKTTVHPPLKGWVVRYVSGPKDVEAHGIKPGYFLGLWLPEGDYCRVLIEPEMHMAFNSESDAQNAVDSFRLAGIEAEIIKVGMAQSTAAGAA